MAVAAEHLLSRDNGRHYHAAADRAIGLARETGNPELIASALFESARAGVETGDEERIASAREEIRLLLLDESSAEFPVVHYARGFCDYFSYDARSAAGSLRRAVDLLQHSREPGELSRALTGLGVCMVDLCEHRGAHESFERALELASRVSDDSRASIISANMCTQKLVEGGFPAAVEYGLTALRFARTARAQPTLSSSYLSLAEAYLMLGEEVRADACQREAVAQHPEHHNWKVKVEFLCQSAFIALLRGSLPEALDLVAAAERQAHGRERAIAPPVGLRLLQLFRLAHTAGPEAALPHARDDRERFRYLHPLLFLDAVACIAWLERAIWGRPTEQTLNDLAEFDRLGALGRKLQLTQEGFIMNDWSTGDRRIGKAGTVT
jgi:tetratricopeptide (TPR) repeat protein